MKAFFFLFTFISLLFYIPQGHLAHATEKKHNQSWSWSYIQPAVGLAFFSNISERGATFYEGYQLYPVFTLELFHPNLKIYAPNIFYRHRWNDYILFRGGLNSVQIETPYTTNKKKKDYQRKDSFEAIGSVELGIPRHGEFTFRISQDISEHNGIATEGHLRWIFYNLPIQDSDLQFALNYALGAGAKEHNIYFYGEGAEESFSQNHHSLSFSVSNSEDHLYPIFEVRYYEVLGDKNRRASIAKDKTHGIHVQLFFVFNVFGP